MSSFTREQQVALAIVPKFSASLSLLASTWIVIEVLTRNSNRKNVYHRILCAMSFTDIVCGAWVFATTWPIPPETNDEVAFACGTETTCTIQGFFIQLNVSAPIYNCCLSLYYLLVIRYKIPEERLQFNVEPAMHVFAVGFGFMTALACTFMGLYNNANLWCWIANSSDCTGTEQDNTNFEQEALVHIFRWSFYYGPLWICILFVTGTMLSIYCTVRQRGIRTLAATERKIRRKQQQIPFSRFQKQASSGGSLELSNPNEDTDIKISKWRKQHPSEKKTATHHPLKEEAKHSVKELTNYSFHHHSSCSSRSKESGAIERCSSLSETLDDISSNNRPTKKEREATAHDLVTHLGSYASASQQAVQMKSFGAQVVYRQALMYTLAFYATFLFGTMNRLLQMTLGVTVFPLILVHSFTIPLQGFFNVIVYRYHNYIRLKQRNPHIPFAVLVRWTFRWTFLGPPREAKLQPESTNSGFPDSCNRNDNNEELDNGVDTQSFASETMNVIDLSVPRLKDEFSNSIEFIAIEEPMVGQFPDPIHGEFAPFPNQELAINLQANY